LEEKETDVVADNVVRTDEVTKKEPVDNQEEEEVEEFDDDELDLDTDYNTNYFDDGEGYMDDDNDVDEGPCF
jgi:DNA-directed RNA polymerase III subunit RPC7